MDMGGGEPAGVVAGVVDDQRLALPQHPAGHADLQDVVEHRGGRVAAGGVAEGAQRLRLVLRLAVNVGEDDRGADGAHRVGQVVEEAGEQRVQLDACAEVAGEVEQQLGLALGAGQAALGPLQPQHGPHAGQQLVDLHRLDQEVVGAGVQAGHAGGEVGGGGEHHHRDEGLAAVGLDPARHLVAVDPRQPQIQQNNIGGDQLEVGDALLAAGGQGDPVAVVDEHIVVDPPDDRVVLDDEDVGRLKHSEGTGHREQGTGAAPPVLYYRV
jgi:hypothetical protein